jgi:hypothetical protein
MSQNFTVFVVEDDEFYSEVLEYHLSLNPDITVRKFTNAQDFLKNLDKNPSLVTLDYSLPDMEGEEAIVTGNGMVMSSGIWRSKTTKSGWYNFVFHGPNSFVLNVVPHDTESSAFIVRGSRVVTEVKRPEQPWYSRLMLPLSMFLLFRRFLAPAEPARAEPARAEPPSAK